MLTLKHIDDDTGGKFEYVLYFEDIVALSRMANGVAKGAITHKELTDLVKARWNVPARTQWIWSQLLLVINTFASALK
jgi:hypothetical protein